MSKVIALSDTHLELVEFCADVDAAVDSLRRQQVLS